MSSSEDSSPGQDSTSARLTIAHSKVGIKQGGDGRIFFDSSLRTTNDPLLVSRYSYGERKNIV